MTQHTDNLTPTTHMYMYSSIAGLNVRQNVWYHVTHSYPLVTVTQLKGYKPHFRHITINFEQAVEYVYLCVHQC